MLFKSTDEGLTWKEITGHGLPTNMAGRTSIAVAMNTNAQRMFLIGNFGFFRSDDGGENWHQMAANDTRIRNGQNGYNCGVYVDPQNPDLVYTINTSSFISRDGGNTFTGFKGAPGGDDPQQMWIDPTNGKRMILGVDQGATVSLDGGLTWSSWYNQATDQVYHISADNSYPYWVYATQQDAGSIATRSRGDFGAITPLDWYPTAGYEFGSIVADPLNPKIVYAGGPGGGIVKITYPSGQWINVSPNVDASEALRKVGNQPILWSPKNPHELLVGFQYLMSTTDGGMHWKKLGPDLTVSDSAAAAEAAGRGAGGRGAPAAAAGGGARPRSSRRCDRIVLTVDDVGGNHLGRHQQRLHQALAQSRGNVARRQHPELAEPDARRHLSDRRVAHGFGRGVCRDRLSHERRLHAVLLSDARLRQDVDEDRQRHAHRSAEWKFCARDSSRYEEAGAAVRRHGELDVRLVRRWRRLAISHAESAKHIVSRHRDQGQRSGDRDVRPQSVDPRRLFPLRQITPAIESEPAHLFKPGDAIRVRRNVNGDTPFPPEVPHALNPPPGAILYYYLGRSRRATSRSTCATRRGMSYVTTRARRLRR